MIIFGSRGVTMTQRTGQFHCPSCQSEREYSLKHVRRFFTLYFIPLIPLDKLGEYVECLSCKDTYKPNVLNYRPGPTREEFEAEYHAAIKVTMILMLLADADIDKSEIETIADIYRRITGRELDKQKLVEEIWATHAAGKGMADILQKLQGSLNDSGKELVLKAAILVAKADGHVHEKERALLMQIGKDLGMSDAHVFGVIQSVG